jgi:hypothetical protein
MNSSRVCLLTWRSPDLYMTVYCFHYTVSERGALPSDLICETAIAHQRISAAPLPLDVDVHMQRVDRSDQDMFPDLGPIFCAFARDRISIFRTVIVLSENCTTSFGILHGCLVRTHHNIPERLQRVHLLWRKAFDFPGAQMYWHQIILTPFLELSFVVHSIAILMIQMPSSGLFDVYGG